MRDEIGANEGWDAPQPDEATPPEAILSVRALTERLRRTLETRYPFVWVRGEVSNLSRPASGHVYFSLKDAEAQLQCVWFRSRQREGRNFDPLTGEVFEGPRPSPLAALANGLELLCAGRVSVYAPRGQYQLVVELVQPAGAGLLAQAFEERKRRLAAAGYFAQERKRALPWNPCRVALITSPGGAAIHDFLELAAARGCASQIRLFPVSVQGERAVPEIVAAMQEANAQAWAEVIVLVRGGGSLEDLWAFNEPPVAEAIFHSRLPVLAGIGHEVDVSLADLTADRRAATPSHAAQLLWPLRAELLQRVDDLEISLDRAMELRLERAAHALGLLERGLAWASPARRLERLAERLALLDAALPAAMRRLVDEKARRLDAVERRRRAAISEESLRAKALRLEMLVAALPRLMGQRMQGARMLLDGLGTRLGRAMTDQLRARAAQLEKLELTLQARDPLAPLERGYALLYRENGALARSVTDFAPGAPVRAQLADGSLGARVEKIVLESGKGQAQ
ncbi:MAG: exodeoxyribonuclease VII large subunit [Desulfovibrio sp.]|nr:exodeoxyribonuclease VII large subunit [Desulfovibrio sp.]